MADEPTIQFEIENLPDVLKDLGRLSDRGEAAVVRATERTLDTIEQAQIKRYTATGHPPPPAGSTYIRTFRLQRGSRRKMERRTYPVLGVWWVDNVEYAPYVLGPRAEQAEIHAGRWKPLEEVKKEAETAHVKHVTEEVNRELTRL